MITGKEDLLGALIEAYLMEKGTNQFYGNAAEETSDRKAQQAFRKLSEWEEQHMEFIRYLYQSITQDRDIEGFSAFSSKTPSPLTEAGIPAIDIEKILVKPQYSDDAGAITFALEMEGKAYNLYRKLSESAADSNAREIFKEMMGQEQKHVDFLKKIRKNIA